LGLTFLLIKSVMMFLFVHFFSLSMQQRKKTNQKKENATTVATASSLF